MDTQSSSHTSRNTEPIKFKLSEPPEDCVEERVLAVLSDFAQPSSTMSIEAAVNSLLDVLPESDPQRGDIDVFGGVYVGLAEQVPYYHTSHAKLAALLEYLGRSTAFAEIIRNEDGGKGQRFVTFTYLRRQLRHQLEGAYPHEFRKQINFTAFVAHLWERRACYPTDPTWALWALRGAHEGFRDGFDRDTSLLVGAQWILWYGQSLFRQVLVASGPLDEDTLRMWSPGPLYKGTSDLTIDRWHFWRDGFVAAGRDENRSEECRQVSAKAVDIMQALEKSMVF